jgi:hypothetical protein
MALAHFQAGSALRGLIFGLLNVASVKVDYLHYEILSFRADPLNSNIRKRYALVRNRHFLLFGLRVRMLKLNKILVRVKFYQKLPGQYVREIRSHLEFKPV